MAVRTFSYPQALTTFPPNGNKTMSIDLITTTYTRKLTYGQIRGIKGVLRLMKNLRVSKKLEDISLNQTAYGEPGFADTYRVRIRYRE